MEKLALQNVYIVATDMGACSRFYQSALGLQLKFQDGDNWRQFDAAGRNFALSSGQEAPAQAKGTIAVFEAIDLEAIAKRVLAAGGQLVSSRDMGAHGQVKTFTDVEGNLFQVYSKSRASKVPPEQAA